MRADEAETTTSLTIRQGHAADTSDDLIQPCLDLEYIFQGLVISYSARPQKA